MGRFGYHRRCPFRRSLHKILHRRIRNVLRDRFHRVLHRVLQTHFKAREHFLRFIQNCRFRRVCHDLTRRRTFCIARLRWNGHHDGQSPVRRRCAIVYRRRGGMRLKSWGVNRFQTHCGWDVGRGNGREMPRGIRCSAVRYGHFQMLVIRMREPIRRRRIDPPDVSGHLEFQRHVKNIAKGARPLHPNHSRRYNPRHCTFSRRRNLHRHPRILRHIMPCPAFAPVAVHHHRRRRFLKRLPQRIHSPHDDGDGVHYASTSALIDARIA